MFMASDGKRKFTLLLAAPASPDGIPTLAELTAATAIDISCEVLDNDSSWTAAASDTVDEKPSCVKGKAQARGALNYDLGLTFLREWKAAGGADVTGADKGYQALKKPDTEAWIYLRETDKDSKEPWAAGDEIYLGGRVITDAPTRPGVDGNIKRRIAFLPQDMIVEELVPVAGP